jgi:1,4-dihydroxy-2-naphthoate octaprenyltransferase
MLKDKKIAATMKAALSSMRLRTLPLSLAGVLLGCKMALVRWQVSGWVVLLVCLTTICLQILSNLSNELGDVLRGTDTDERQGPAYGLNSGEMTVAQMRRLIAALVLLCCISGAAMIWVSFGTFLAWKPAALLVLGACAIWAAMKYTLGRNPYGYRGLGDIFVFVFFGLVSVLGAYFVCAHRIDRWELVLPAAGIGFFSVGVLNINNIRDMRTDAVNRVTMALRLGLKGARIYQTVLIGLGWAALICFAVLMPSAGIAGFVEGAGAGGGAGAAGGAGGGVSDVAGMAEAVSGAGVVGAGVSCVASAAGVAGVLILRWAFLLVLPMFILHLRGVWTTTDRALDRYFPLLVMGTFLLALLY